MCLYFLRGAGDRLARNKTHLSSCKRDNLNYHILRVGQPELPHFHLVWSVWVGVEGECTGGCESESEGEKRMRGEERRGEIAIPQSARHDSVL